MLSVRLPPKHSARFSSKNIPVVERIRRRTMMIQQAIQGEVEKPQTLSPHLLQSLHERNVFLKSHPEYLKYGISFLADLILQKSLKLLNFNIALTILMRERQVDTCFSYQEGVVQKKSLAHKKIDQSEIFLRIIK